LAFVVAKLATYVILGLLLGLIGTTLQPSLFLRAIFQGLVAIYMLGVAGALLQLHPLFRYFIFSPPKFITRWIRSQSKSDQLFTPVILGASTVLIPCGTTQAMMALALASASPLWGAAIMGAFVLGTWPLFLGLGILVSGVLSGLNIYVLKFAALGIVAMSLWTLTGAFALAGRPINLASLSQSVYCTLTFCPPTSSSTPVDHLTIDILNSGYRADSAVLKAGSKVTLTLTNSQASGCAQAFTIPALQISEFVPPGTTKDITITVPSTPGRLAYTCAMGMFSGEFSVVN
jgi:sulfite exporter TauE/SafE